MTICDAMLDNDIHIEHSCEKSCACTTCHVYIREGFDELDPRITGIATEEIANGITCYMLREHFNLIHIADAKQFIDDFWFETISKKPEYQPDYIAQGIDGKVVICESKGALGTRSTLNRKKKGISIRKKTW